MRFCDNLKQCRKKKGLTQAQLAELISVSQSTVGNWEAGTREPDLQTIIELSKLFSVSMNDLLGVTIPIEKKEKPSAASERWERFRIIYEGMTANEQHRIDNVLDALMSDPEDDQGL